MSIRNDCHISVWRSRDKKGPPTDVIRFHAGLGCGSMIKDCEMTVILEFGVFQARSEICS